MPLVFRRILVPVNVEQIIPPNPNRTAIQFEENTSVGVQLFVTSQGAVVGPDFLWILLDSQLMLDKAGGWDVTGPFYAQRAGIGAYLQWIEQIDEPTIPPEPSEAPGMNEETEPDKPFSWWDPSTWRRIK